MEGPVFVTGATGFIGRHLVTRLVSEGHAVRALALPDEPVPPMWYAGVEVRRGDVTDAAAMRQAVRGCGLVYHLAALVQDWGSATDHERVTVGGTRHVLGAAAAHGVRSVLVSSVVYYGADIAHATLDEDRPPGRPVGLYSRSKQAQERIAAELSAQGGLPLTIVRPTNVFGPGSRPWVQELLALLREGQPTVIGDGSGNAGLCYVENLVDLLIEAGRREVALGRSYNASDGSGITWRRYMEDIASIGGAPAPRALPRAIARGAAALMEPAWRLLRRQERPLLTREALNLVGSDFRVPIDRARRELGYEPRVDYETGLEQIAASLGTED